MPSYKLTAKVDQIVTKQVQLVVTADSEEEAQHKARLALNEYPKPVTESGIDRVVTQKADYWIPRDVQFTSTKKIDSEGPKAA